MGYHCNQWHELLSVFLCPVKFDGKRRTTYSARKIQKLQPGLLYATVVEPLSDLDQWGVLNVLCVLLPKLALSRMT